MIICAWFPAAFAQNMVSLAGLPSAGTGQAAV
ncbi:hypothetical protein BH24BAC1_BH24BAC1_21390 [soil metagenome]